MTIDVFGKSLNERYRYRSVSRKRPRIDNPIVGTANQNESLNINGGEYDAHKRRIINLGEPLNHTDAVTKSYVDIEVKKKENNEDPTKIDKKKLDDFNKITTNVQLQNDKVKNEIEELDLKNKAKQFEEDFDRKKSEIEKMESNVKLLSDSVKNEIKKLNLDDRVKKFEEDFNRKKSEIEKLKSSVKSLSEKLQDEIKNLNLEYRGKRFEEDFNNRKSEIEKLESNVKSLSESVKSEIKNLNLNDKRKKFEEDFNRKKSEIEKIKRFEEDFGKKRSKIEKLENNVKLLSESVQSEIKNLNLDDKRKKFEEDFNGKKNEIEKLENSVKSLSEKLQGDIKNLNLDNKRNKFEEDFSKKKSEIEKLEKSVKLLSEKLQGDIKNMNWDDKRKKFEEDIGRKKNEIEKLESSVKSLSESVKTEIKKLNLNDRMKKFEEDFDRKKSEIEKLENNVKYLSQNVKDEIKKVDLSNQINEFNKYFEQKKNKFENLENKMKSINDYDTNKSLKDINKLKTDVKALNDDIKGEIKKQMDFGVSMINTLAEEIKRMKDQKNLTIKPNFPPIPTKKKQLVDELHAPTRKNFIRRRVIVRGYDDLWQADLVDMRLYSKINKNHQYILTIIDVFSKYAWAIPIKTKSGKNVTHAFSKVLEERKPKNLQTDDGTEFYNTNFQQLMKHHGINHYSTYSILKASVVERFNRTLKSSMWKMFTFNGNYQWLNILSNLVKDYNNRKHRTIGMSPQSVTIEREKDLLKNVYNFIKIAAQAKYKVGDAVRISKYKHLFNKGYTPNWTTEVFRIEKVQRTNPITYLLKDSTGQSIAGGFYEYELHSVANPNVYLVEKVLRKNGNKVFVKWLGLNSNHNSWINKNNVL
ncbi:myosin heavy chain, clone 203-like [Prorops nasuta]|uniref:myosin heavy chain, clone 203-like n=1 Tax=Prorops nasuta TaxID=863751 RepID=UPI0034CE4A37